MNDIEIRLRATLRTMSDEVEPVSFLSRLDENRSVSLRRHRLALATVAATVVGLLLVAVSVLTLVARDDTAVEPTMRPPKLVRLAGPESDRPGRSALLVVVADVEARDFVHEKPAYVLPVGGRSPLLLSESDTEPTWTEHLSADGTRVVRRVSETGPPWAAERESLEIVDLRTGAVQPVRGHEVACPALSPDNTVMAAWRGDDAVLIDLSSGGERVLRDTVQSCGTLAWAPDGRRLVVPHRDGSRIVDRRGRSLIRVSGRTPVSAQSWSPDGQRLLLYDEDGGRFVVRETATGAEQVLRRPDGGVKPVGWAGARVVWLAGDAADARLVTTDDGGDGVVLWTRLDTGGLPVESVSWSRDLSGSPGG